MRKLAINGFGVIAILISLALVGWVAVDTLLLRWVIADATCEHTFVINENFDQVRKIMVRTNPLQTLVELRGNRLVEHKFDNLDLQMDRFRDPNWEIKGQGWFIVETNNEHIGKQMLFFDQHVHVTKDYLFAEEIMKQPAGRLNGYSTTIEMFRDGEATKVRVRVFIRYSRKATEYHRTMIQSGVNEAASKEVQTTERGLQILVDRYRNAMFILPNLQRAAGGVQ